MGKGVKSCGKVCSSLYIEYIIKEYKGKQRCGAKGKECAGRVFLFSVYRYSIIEIREIKGAGQRYVYYIDI